jgi:hypothetical protein
MPEELMLSDLHAHDVSAGNTPSSFKISAPENQPALHPISGLKKLIQDEAIAADMVLCPGDLADKANAAALKVAWDELFAIKGLLKAKHLIATAGNHDMDSRYQHSGFDAKGNLQALVPMFPGLEEGLWFWARNYAIVEGDFWRVLVLNSSAYHGAGKDQGKEFQHGASEPPYG